MNQYLSFTDAEMLIAIWTNPKNRFWYDVFTGKHPEWDGDFADFVANPIEDFFKTRGYELVLRRSRPS